MGSLREISWNFARAILALISQRQDSACQIVADRSVHPNRIYAGGCLRIALRMGTFDAVYSAHMIYHIDDIKAQEMALSDLMRVVRPGGIVVLITANPRPLLFPIRFLKRVVPQVGSRRSCKNPLTGAFARSTKRHR